MALGRKSEVVDVSNAQDIAAMQEKNNGAFGSDPEKADPLRKMGRVGGGLNTDTDVDSTISVGKQIELEQTQSIKYRTCSWQKVGSRILSPLGQGAQDPLGGCKALFCMTCRISQSINELT